MIRDEKIHLLCLNNFFIKPSVIEKIIIIINRWKTGFFVKKWTGFSSTVLISGCDPKTQNKSKIIFSIHSTNIGCIEKLLRTKIIANKKIHLLCWKFFLIRLTVLNENKWIKNVNFF